MFPYDSQQPSHKNDLLCQTQQDYNLHTHNPDNEDRIKINYGLLYHNKLFEQLGEKIINYVKKLNQIVKSILNKIVHHPYIKVMKYSFLT